MTIRFAHPYGWDAKDPIVKEDIHAGEVNLVVFRFLFLGLRDLYAHGVNLGALDFQGILEEMRLDGLEELEDEARVRELIRQRQNYLSSESKQVTKGGQEPQEV